MLGCLKQVSWSRLGSKGLGLDEYMDYRRGSVGAYPAFVVIEYEQWRPLERQVLD